jgi:hypothetical protein
MASPDFAQKRLPGGSKPDLLGTLICAFRLGQASSSIEAASRGTFHFRSRVTATQKGAATVSAFLDM